MSRWGCSQWWSGCSCSDWTSWFAWNEESLLRERHSTELASHPSAPKSLLWVPKNFSFAACWDLLTALLRTVNRGLIMSIESSRLERLATSWFYKKSILKYRKDLNKCLKNVDSTMLEATNTSRCKNHLHPLSYSLVVVSLNFAKPLDSAAFLTGLRYWN